MPTPAFTYQVKFRVAFMYGITYQVAFRPGPGKSNGAHLTLLRSSQGFVLGG